MYNFEIVSASAIIYVDDDNNMGPWDGSMANPYQTIQDGIDAALDGDTVYVFAGTYYENIVVNRTINLIGEKRDFTIIYGSGIDDIVKITKDYVNITGFTITPPTVEGDVGLGVDSNYNNISGNKVEIKDVGICLRSSIGNIITENEMIENGIHIIGNQLEHWNSHTIDISNTVNGKSVYYWKNQNAGSIPSDAGQVFLVNCTNIIIADLNINNLSYGIELGFSSSNYILNSSINTTLYDGIVLYSSDMNNITNNNVSNSRRGKGIYLGSSNLNNITNNYVFSNHFQGIYLGNSNKNNIMNNHASNSYEGILLHYSDENYIFGNTAINNHFMGGIYLRYSSNNTIENNTLNLNICSGIRFDYSYFNLIKNNTCNDAEHSGILLLESEENIIENNIAANNTQFGIFFTAFCYGNIISNNTASGNSLSGIFFYLSSNNTIINNIVTSNLEHGIYLKLLSSNNSIINNNITNNDMGIFIEEYSNNTNIYRNSITTNNMGANIIYSFENIINNNTISMNNEYGIRVFDSADNKVTNNIISDNNDGIILEYIYGANDIENNFIFSNSQRGIWIYWYASENNIRFNNISNNLIGINISTYSEDNEINTNNISNNLVGVVIDSSDSNTITKNNLITNTLYAINITSGEFNLIYHNNFIDNNGGGIQANDNAGGNGWYINYPTGGNYWNDWTTPDTKSGPNQDQPGSDGFVDFPYYLDGGANAMDRYPFAAPMDFAPPEITNLKPPDGSTINDTTPTISANYSDPSGIDTGSVILTVNGMDFTSSATVTENGVSYTPGTALSDGVYTVYVEVQDVFGYMASETWSFTVDATPPEITNLQPPDVSTINDTTPPISADYSDPSGINLSSVMLMVDGVDVTSSAIVTVIDMSYIPGIALSEGVHTVYLEVRDNVGNLATVTWSFTVDLVLPPPSNLITKVVNNGNKVELEWEPPISPILDHYLIYRADSQTEFDFTTPYNSSVSWLDPLNTTWIDPDPSITQIDDDFYYIVRAANFDESDISSTSNTAGVWTRTFEPGISTFSLPLETFVKKDAEFYCQDMNASYIKWMDHTKHTWMKHDKGNSDNNTLLKLGEGYEIGFIGISSQTRYSFCGLPGAMIVYDDDSGFVGFDPNSEAKNLSLSVESNGDVILTWKEPSSMISGDWYDVYYSNTRDGFFGTLGMDYGIACPSIGFGTNTTTISGLGASDPGARLYIMVVPFNASGVRGSSTYSIGVWTEEYLSEYDTMGIPLKLDSIKTADWYCNNIPDCVGINYYISNDQRWGWHATRMPAGAFDVVLEIGEGYQISTSGATRFTFVGI